MNRARFRPDRFPPHRLALIAALPFGYRSAQLFVRNPGRILQLIWFPETPLTRISLADPIVSVYFERNHG